MDPRGTESIEPGETGGGTARRTVMGAGVLGLAATAAAACSSSSASGGGTAATGGVLAKTTDIPVGGGKVFKDQKVVVTQPQAGEFKAFSAVCTHMGCTVSSVSGGTINCPCHGSRYKITDASVVSGPAPQPLPAQTITVSGTDIKLS